MTAIELASHWCVVLPDSLPGRLVEGGGGGGGGAGLQQMSCCRTASTTRALLCRASAELGAQVVVEAVVACPEPEHYHLHQASSTTTPLSTLLPITPERYTLGTTGAGIMEADDRQVTIVFIVQPSSFHHWHSTNQVP